MDGHGTAIRRRSDQLRTQGDELRRTAATLLARALEMPWEGRAAESMRHRIEDRARRLREAADVHDRAADALDRHLAALGGESGGTSSW